MTYKNIILEVRRRFGLSVKTCWIAHVKELNGLPVRRSWNRDGARKHPCPSRCRKPIETVLNLK